MERNNNHYYMIAGVHRLENMKEVQEFLGTKSKPVIRRMRQSGFIEKIELGLLDGNQNIIVDENRG